MADLVRDEGFTAVAAADGRQALEMLTSGLRPIGILLDMMMPVMDSVRASAWMDTAQYAMVAFSLDRQPGWWVG